jgi:dimethylsulfone monooxygenase
MNEFTSAGHLEAESRHTGGDFARRHTLTLGIFSSNLSGGLAVTTVPESWSGNWADNLALATMIDTAGFDFMLPVARWNGFNGAGHYAESVLDPVALAAAVLAVTKQITVFSTIHTAFHHPIAIAKQLATLHEIGAGRAGLNIVCGWNKNEYTMFGMDLPSDHGTRYRMGQEWYEIMSRIWRGDAPFEYAGQHFKLGDVTGKPRPPAGRPIPILNAASSPEGREFAVRNADTLFTVLTELEKGRTDVSSFKTQARASGREIGVFTPTYVVCRPTRAEAEDYHRYYADECADHEAVEKLMALQGLHSRSFEPDAYQRFKIRFAGGSGVYPLIGTPDDIADELERISQAGFDGATLSFVNYVAELPLFISEVLPRLEKKGLRLPVEQFA